MRRDKALNFDFGEWDNMELDIEKEVNRKYNDVNNVQSEQLFDNEDDLMF